MEASTELREAFRRDGELRELRKTDALLMQGEVSRHIYLVESGCLRLWHNDDGNDVSVKFFLPGELVSSLESFHYEQPSKFGLQAVVPSVVRVATKQTCLALVDSSPRVRDYFHSVTVHCMSDFHDLFLDRIKNSPESRYKLLCAQDPELLDVVPQHNIASYLGVTPVSLSRIRKKVANN